VFWWWLVLLWFFFVLNFCSQCKVGGIDLRLSCVLQHTCVRFKPYLSLAYSFRASSVVFLRNNFVTQFCRLKSQFVQVQKTVILCCIYLHLMFTTSINLHCCSIMMVWHVLTVSCYMWQSALCKCQCLVCFSSRLCFCFQSAKLCIACKLWWQCAGCHGRPVSGQKTGGRKQSPSTNSQSKTSMAKMSLWRSTGKQAVDTCHRWW